MNDANLSSSRRGLLKGLGVFGGVLAMARGAISDDPFDALPPGAWRNARWNGLVMVRHPAPAGISSHAKITQAGEPGDPLVVNGQ